MPFEEWPRPAAPRAPDPVTVHRLAVLTTTLLVVCVLSWRITDGQVHLDQEGIATVGAQRILHGDVPYRDFWTIYAPGNFYVLAALFAVFGYHLLVARLASIALAIVAMLLFFCIVRRWSSLLIALAATILAATVLHPAARFYGSYPTVLVCILGAILAASAYFHAGRRRWIFTAGFACSLAVIFKHDVGGYVALAILLTLLLRRLPASRAVSIAVRLRDELVSYFAGCVIVAVPVYGLLLITAGPFLWENLVRFPLTDFPATRPEAYPGPIPDWSACTSPARTVEELSERLRFAMPTLLCLMSIVWMLVRRSRMENAHRASQLLVTMCIPFFWMAAHVQINTHIYTMTLLGIMLTAIVMKDAAPLIIRQRTRFIGSLAATALCLGAWLPRPAFEMLRPILRSDPVTTLALPRIHPIRTDQSRCVDAESAVRYVRRNTAPDDPVYVGLTRHDTVIISAPLLYFLLQRPIATRYHELHPGIVDTLPVQEEITRSLSDANPRFAILWEPFDNQTLDRIKASRLRTLPDTGATRLDEFLDESYEEVERFGRFVVCKRRSS